MMIIAPDYPLPTAQLRRATALVKVPRVLIAAVLWLLLVEAVHGLAAWGVLALVVAGTVASVVAEEAMVRLLWWARRPSTPVTVPEDPRVRVLITSRQAAGIGQSGRRHLVVPAAWVGRADLPALLRRARLRQVVSAGRFEVAYQWFTWPWQILGSFVDGIGSGASRLPLIGFAWRVRFVVAGIAVWQTVVAARYAAWASSWLSGSPTCCPGPRRTRNDWSDKPWWRPRRQRRRDGRRSHPRCPPSLPRARPDAPRALASRGEASSPVDGDARPLV